MTALAPHVGLGRYEFDSAQVIGHHGVWGAFAFWCPELDAIITGTVNTAKADRRPLLAAVVEALPANLEGARNGRPNPIR